MSCPTSLDGLLGGMGLGFLRCAGFCGSIAAARGRCPCSLQAGAGSSPSSSRPGAAVPCCIQGHMGLGNTGLGLGAWSGAARGSSASLGSSQELFDASGSRCAAAAGFLHTAVGAYSALGFCRCHFPPSRPFVKEPCLRQAGGGDAQPGSRCAEVGAGRPPALPQLLDFTRVFTQPAASETSNPDWSLFARGADR